MRMDRRSIAERRTPRRVPKAKEKTFTRAEFDRLNQAYVDANHILGILPIAREYPIYRVAKVLLARFAPHVKLDPSMEIGPGEDLVNFHQWLGRREDRKWKPRKKKS